MATLVQKNVSTISGFVMVIFGVLLMLGGAGLASFEHHLVAFAVCELLGIIALAGLMVINPGEARVLQLFGSYKGTVTDEGLRWVNPFYTKKMMSLRARSFESAKLKVNDRDGSPIEIGVIVVWRVTDTAKASFAVENFERFVQIQSEAGVRTLAVRYPYDSPDHVEASLRSATQEITDSLAHELTQRIGSAGVEVVETRISHLAYAPEIAHAMLQRQQAQAMIAARAKLVEGAVGMVEHALQLMSEKGMVVLDDERRAHMVSNLLVVLCGQRETTPVVNAGTMHA